MFEGVFLRCNLKTLEHLAHPKANSSFGAALPQLAVTFLRLIITMKERVTVETVNFLAYIFQLQNYSKFLKVIQLICHFYPLSFNGYWLPPHYCL